MKRKFDFFKSVVIFVCLTLSSNIHANNSPVITEGASTTVTMSEDASPMAFSLTLNATDTEIEDLNWSIDSQATNGTASVSETPIGTSQVISYTPTADYNGSDEFIVKVADANGSSTITVNVIIDAVNDTPIFTTTLQDSLVIEKSEIKRYTLNVNDIEGDELNVSVESNDTSLMRVTSSWNSSINYVRYANESLEFNLTTAQNIKGSAKITIITNDGELNSTKSFNIDIDTKVPEVVNIKLDSVSSKGPYLSEGDELIFDVEFTEIVIVNGTPQLYFMVDNKQYNANYTEGTGSKVLVFKYIVPAEGMNLINLYIDANQIYLNGGSVAKVTPESSRSAVIYNNFDINITNSDIPTMLNTSNLDKTITGFIKKYGPNKTVDLEIIEFEAPSITDYILDDNGTISISGVGLNLAFYVGGEGGWTLRLSDTTINITSKFENGEWHFNLISLNSDTMRETVNRLGSRHNPTQLANFMEMFNSSINIWETSKLNNILFKRIKHSTVSLNVATPTFTTNLENIIINENDGTRSYALNATDTDIQESNLTITVKSSNTNILTVSQGWTNLVSQANWKNVALEFNLTTVENASGLVQISVIVDDGELNTISTFEINVKGFDSDGDGVLDRVDICPNSYGNQSNGCYYQAEQFTTIDSNNVNNVNIDSIPKAGYEVKFSDEMLKDIIDKVDNKTIQAKEFFLNNGAKSQAKVEIPKDTAKSTNLKASVEVTNENLKSDITTLETEDRVKITLTKDGGFTSKVENSEVEAEVKVDSNSEGNIKIIVQKRVQVDLKTPKGSEIRQDNSGKVTSFSNISADTGEANIKNMKVEMSAEVTGNLVTSANITNNNGETLTYKLALPNNVDNGQMELIKSDKSSGSNTIYKGIQSNFKTKNSFKITDKSKRAVIDGQNIEIIGTTDWQKFEERQYFDGNRTIKLLLGGANVIKNGVEEGLVKDIEYKLPPSFGNSSTNQNLSPIYGDNYLHLTKGWSLISSPINSEIDIKKSFNTSDISYKFENNSWIKKPEILKPNEGIWVKYNFDIDVYFDEYNSNESYEFSSTLLNSGWNLVGTGVDITLTGDYENIWAFDNIDKTWISNPSQILRGYGFWIKY